MQASNLVEERPARAALSPTEIEIGFTLGLLSLRKGVAPPGAIGRTLLSAWGYPGEFTKGGGAGEHGQPEMARLEAKHFDVVRGGGRETLRTLNDLVTRLYDEGRGWDSIDPFTLDEPLDAWRDRAINELATHPLSAFLLGQLFATESLDRAQGRPLVPEDRKAVEFLNHYHLNELSSKFNALKHDIRHELIAGVESGENPRDVSRRMASTLKDYETDFGTIAVTETARAETYGRLREFEDQDVHWVEGSSAYDTRVCDHCSKLIDGKKYRVSEVINVSNYGRKQADWVACIPMHPLCRCLWLPVEV